MTITTQDVDSMPIKKDIWDIIAYVWNLFRMAVEKGASDIHIEPTEKYLLVRFRKDGDFMLIDKIDKEHSSAIITRLKVLSKIKIDENKKPQDWKIVFYYDPEKTNIDIRLSTLPIVYWEKVVMRILKQDPSLINIDALGFIDVNIQKIKDVLKTRFGMILVAWPTGSWKSTTLFWIIKSFNPLEYNISTLEDPVEYDMNFVNQSQVKPEIGYSFSTWLRSIVRQDPDIIMVWEIRDKETAVLAVEAALTWHLVFSTIHTNSAAATIQRLINMGVEPYLVASAMKMVISQRLWKKICPFCKEEHKLTEIEQKKVTELLLPVFEKKDIEAAKFYEWKWCEHCSNTGYLWRMWFHEVMVVWDYLEPLIINKESASLFKEAAVNNWMLTIIQDALVKAMMWETTVEEALKLI